LITRTMLGEEYRSVSSAMLLSPLSCYLVPLRSKYSPQHPQSTFLTQCVGPSFTPIHNRQKRICTYQNCCSQIQKVHIKHNNCMPVFSSITKRVNRMKINNSTGM
jgi:hypothetical protein